MNMVRQKLDEYLDGALSASERAEVDRQLAADPALARMLSRMNAERSLRSAVYAGYEPSAEEARALAAKMMAVCADEATAPIGRIGIWVKRSLGVAAAAGIIAGSFALGRTTAPRAGAATAMAAQVEVIRVLYSDDAGEPQMKEFASMDDANAFCKDMNERHAEPVVVASGFDTDHPGSF
jgi:anti-sigma factor RsiW